MKYEESDVIYISDMINYVIARGKQGKTKENG